MERKGKTVAQILAATSKRPTLVNDFHYVVHKPKKAKICFGSMQERAKTAVTTRFGIAREFEINKNTYPGKYGTPPEKKVVSLKGTVLGGRTAERNFSLTETDGPSPATYRVLNDNNPLPLFGFGELRRFPRTVQKQVVGPGYYDVTKEKKSIAYRHSFGGKQAIIPPIALKCRPINTDLCEKCKKTPIGDYWTLVPNITCPTTFFLCRPCYEIERKVPQLFSKSQLRSFKKIRDCSQIHFHGGCEARILLTSPRIIDEITKKEAYLSLFFP